MFSKVVVQFYTPRNSCWQLTSWLHLAWQVFLVLAILAAMWCRLPVVFTFLLRISLVIDDAISS